MTDDTARSSLPLAAAGPSCGCGCADDSVPALDVRTIPHAIRHGSVFGALGVIPPGGMLVLVAPHDPKPLLAQIDQREHGAISVCYLETGPDVWRLLLTREVDNTLT